MTSLNHSMRIPLSDKQQNLTISQHTQEQPQQQPITNPKSQRKSSPSLLYKRLSFYSKQKAQIPTIKQAKNRQKQIKHFHNRTFYKRKRNLQQIFKQNMRIYDQLNKQKSHYSTNFKSDKFQKKSKKSHSVSCSQHHTTKYIDLQKCSRDQNFQSSNKIKFQRRYSFSVGRTGKKDIGDRENGEKQIQDKNTSMNKAQSEFILVNFRKYEKNKTEMLPKRSKMLAGEYAVARRDKSCELNVGVEGNRKNNGENLQNTDRIDKIEKMFTSTSSKNPALIRMKKRPSSGFRF